MQNKKIKVKVKINIPAGMLESIEEKFKKLKENPIDFIEEEDILYKLKLIIDNYSIEDWKSALEVDYEVIDKIK